MQRQINFIYVLFLLYATAVSQIHHHSGAHDIPSWLINLPPSFAPRNSSSMPHQHQHSHQPLGHLVDVRGSKENMTVFEQLIETSLPPIDAFTDGEIVDALEHFFWGMRDGLAMELGALDGSPNTRSMTVEYEKSLGWKRILIEGNPRYKDNLIRLSPLAFSVNAAICERHATVHFIDAEYTGGMAEFMGMDFLKSYHPKVYNAGTPPGNVSSIAWDKLQGVNVAAVDCVPLGLVLHRAHVSQVNYFILDVEVSDFMTILHHILLSFPSSLFNTPSSFSSFILASHFSYFAIIIKLIYTIKTP